MEDSPPKTPVKTLEKSAICADAIELPRQYEVCDVEHVILLVSDLITETMAINDISRSREAGMTLFHSFSVPSISIHDYLVRLTRHAALAPGLLLSTVYYMDRLSALYPSFIMGSLTAHRFLIAAATVAAKSLSDHCYSTAHYALIGGVSSAELRLLQRELLSRVQWQTVPDPDVLLAYYHGLVERSGRFGLANGTNGT
ncbi:hypothetical protein BR93DRAFT_873565 [Coniochaeta sp. PMI_546]|nr:hypothetical protein BR93DRAFT_873565 [Coniochaeta sp. PMI_546]